MKRRNRHNATASEGKTGSLFNWYAYVVPAIFFFGDLFTLLAIWGNSNDINQIEVTFRTLRMILIVFALFLFFLRSQAQNYLPSVTEMNVSGYWHLVIILCLLLRAPFLRYLHTDSRPGFLMLEMVATAVLGTRFFYSIESKQWATTHQKKRLKRINTLRKKAKLNKKELTSLEPLLYEKAHDSYSNNKSKGLIVFQYVFTIGLGAMLNSYAGIIFIWMKTTLGIDFTNFLPPY